MSNCWLCDQPLDEDEVQYCTCCELEMLHKILEETDQNKEAA